MTMTTPVHGYPKRYRGSGHVWQGRAFPISEEDHLLIVLRSVELNLVRAALVTRAEDWRWSSLPVWLQPPLIPWLHPGLVPRHPGWLEQVQAPHTEFELTALRRSVERRAPYGTAEWVERTTKQLGVESSLHPTGRPWKPGNGHTEQGGLFREKES